MPKKAGGKQKFKWQRLPFLGTQFYGLCNSLQVLFSRSFSLYCPHSYLYCYTLWLLKSLQNDNFCLGLSFVTQYVSKEMIDNTLTLSCSQMNVLK